MIEDQLREIDLDAETRGWQSGPHSNPRLFVVWEDEETHALRWTMPDPLNDAFDEIQQLFGGNVGLAVKHLSEARDKRARVWRSSGLPGVDKVVGVGIRAEAARGASSLLDMLNLISGKPTQTRFTSFLARTGEVSQVNHDRGEVPTFSHTVNVGNGVEQAMGLLLEALVSEPIRFPWSEK